MTICLLRLCQIDLPPRPSLLPMVLVDQNAALRSDFASLAQIVTYLLLELIATLIETGAGEYDLAVSKTHANQLRNELGLNFASCQCLKGVKTTIDTKFGWVRETRLHGKSVRSEFMETAVPVYFTVEGYFPSRNLLSLGASVTAIAFEDRLTCTLYYNGAFGANYSDNGIGGQFSLGF